MKLSISIKCIKKATKSLRVGTSGLKIEAKEKDSITAGTKSIIPLLQAFHIYA